MMNKLKVRETQNRNIPKKGTSSSKIINGADYRSIVKNATNKGNKSLSKPRNNIEKNQKISPHVPKSFKINETRLKSGREMKFTPGIKIPYSPNRNQNRNEMKNTEINEDIYDLDENDKSIQVPSSSMTCVRILEPSFHILQALKEKRNKPKMEIQQRVFEDWEKSNEDYLTNLEEYLMKGYVSKRKKEKEKEQAKIREWSLKYNRFVNPNSKENDSGITTFPTFRFK